MSDDPKHSGCSTARKRASQMRPELCENCERGEWCENYSCREAANAYDRGLAAGRAEKQRAGACDTDPPTDAGELRPSSSDDVASVPRSRLGVHSAPRTYETRSAADERADTLALLEAYAVAQVAEHVIHKIERGDHERCAHKKRRDEACAECGIHGT